MKSAKCLFLVPLLLLTLFVSSVVRADALNYDFTGTLASTFAGSDTVTGQFTIDFSADSTHAISAFSFTTPFGTVDRTDYNVFVVNFDGFLGLLFQAPPIQLNELVLWFQTPTPFLSASLYTGSLPGPVAGAVGPEGSVSLASCEATPPVGGCTGVLGVSTFATGTVVEAAPVVATPEPSSLSLLAIGLLAVLAWTTRSKLLRRWRGTPDTAFYSGVPWVSRVKKGMGVRLFSQTPLTA